MQHISDDDLVLTYYGEDGVDASQHLDVCGECRARYQALQRTLNVVDIPAPERAGDYGAQVWSRLEPKLGSGARQRWWVAPKRWIAAAAMASVALAAFVAGRFLPDASAPVATIANERVLVGAVGDHLERSQFVLAEVLNGEGGDVATERSRARTLIGANRLYRTAAAANGDAGVAMLLDDLERILLEIAHSPDELSPQQLEAIRDRVEQQSLLFKIRVLSARMRRELRPAPDGTRKL